MRWGNSTLTDLLAVRDVTIQQVGEQELVGIVQRNIDAHNIIVDRLYNDIAAPAPDKTVAWSGGSVKSHRPYKVTEHGRVDVGRGQITPATASLGFRLDRWQWALGFTRDYFETKTPADMAEKVMGIEAGDMDQYEYELRYALYNPTNDLGYVDYLIDNVNIPLRALLNADGAYIPPSPEGLAFDPATHTHYAGVTSLSAGAISALILNVAEHGLAGDLRVYINSADAAAVSAMANFRPYLRPGFREVPGNTPGTQVPANQPPVLGADTKNRAIGTWDYAVEVWVKDHIVPAGYIMAHDSGRAIVGRRVRSAAAAAPQRGTLRVIADHEHFPLRAQWMEREYGFNVWNRSAAAILYVGGVSYTMPTFTMTFA